MKRGERRAQSRWSSIAPRNTGYKWDLLFLESPVESHTRLLKMFNKYATQSVILWELPCWSVSHSVVTGKLKLTPQTVGRCGGGMTFEIIEINPVGGNQWQPEGVREKSPLEREPRELCWCREVQSSLSPQEVCLKNIPPHFRKCQFIGEAADSKAEDNPASTKSVTAARTDIRFSQWKKQRKTLLLLVLTTAICNKCWDMEN